MVRSRLRGARAACILFLVAVPTLCTAAEPGFGKVSDPERLRGCGVTIGFSDGKRYVLTAAHCLKPGVRFDDRPATVLAKDESTDIALLLVEMPAPSSYPHLAPEGVNSGSGTRYGYPDYKYTEDSCSMDDDGKLSVTAIPGASGGPIVSSSRYVCGIITHTTYGVPAHKIRSFLAANGYAWLYKADVVRKSPADDDFDKQLQEIRDITNQFKRLAIEEERMYQRHLDNQARMYRRFLDEMPKPRD